ncbi:MAG: nuclear transport factor 2 family protein [Sphingomonas sp.]|jgi:hypothetical protein|uniref:nuclear transport factor 2 family protein n=1 Tax=Sphingomonas sp. TaxID=28214 RepID=UPI0035659833
MTGPGKLSRRALALSGLGAISGAALAPAAAAPRRRKAALSLDDRAAVADLFTNYVWAYDCTDEDEFLALFVSDAIVVGKGAVHRGKPDILGWFRYLVAMREREGDDTWMHEASQFRFEPTATGCIVYAYATHFNGNTAKAARGVRSLGYFTCECVKQGGEWHFSRFSISAWDRTKVPWKKPLPWADLPPA